MKRLISPFGCLSLLLWAGAACAQHDGSNEPGRLLRSSTTNDRKLDMYVPPPPPPPVYEPPTPPPTFYAPPPTPPPTIYYAPPPTPPPYTPATPRPVPTANPTKSNAPSRDPSSKPSSTPSAKPSRSATPSAAPSSSFSPSADPTRSVHPSAEPSASLRPSAEPSRSVRPSAKPSAKPSSVPSRQPSNRPSMVPSSQPTDERVLTVTFDDLSLTLFGIDGLDFTDIPVWENETVRFILNYFSSQRFGLLDLQASVRIQAQSRRLVSRTNGRNLQDGPSVEIFYSQTIQMLVESKHIELDRLAFEWLRDQLDRDRYTRRLRRSGNSRLSLVTSVSEITGSWPDQPTPTPDGPYDLIPVVASLDGISMRLIGVTNLTNADIERWRVATIDYVEDYITRSDDFGVYDFSTTFSEIVQTDGLPQVRDTVINYNQTFTFSTSDQSRVPELVQLISSLPFCRPGDRLEYVERYLRIEGGALANVVQTEPVKGTDFVCPSRNEVCTGAVPIRANNGTTFGTLSSNAGLDVYTECGYYDAPRAWFSFNGTGEVISISTCSSVLNFDSGITVSSGSCVNQECIVPFAFYDADCTLTASSAAKVVVRTEIGKTYFIVVEGPPNLVQGRFGLTVSTLEAPRNDVCTGAVEIQPNGRPTFGSITNASSEYGRNYFCSYDFYAPTVWYVLEGTGGIVAVTTCSQELDFDSALSVSTGNCNTQQCVTNNAYNQFDCSISGKSAARVVFRTIPQVNYFIVVEGLNYNSQGHFALTASTLTPVPNDGCINATRLQPNGSVLGTITNATGSDSYCVLSTNNPSVWYNINGTGGVIEFSTCSQELDFRTGLSIISGTCGNQQCLVPSFSGSDICTTLSFHTELGVNYYIIVEGVDSPSEGVFRLSTRTIPTTPNAVCSGALPLPRNGSVKGTITNTLGVPTPCSERYNTPALWYTLNGTGSEYELSTCSDLLNFDSAITISRSCGYDCIVNSISDNIPCPASPTGVASRYVLPTTSGETYFIAVEGLDNPVAKDFNLRVTPVDAPKNDQCSGAILIPSNDTAINGSTIFATYDSDTGSCVSDGDQATPDVWYRVKGTGDYLTASLCGSVTEFDTQMSIYASCSDKSCIKTNDDFGLSTCGTIGASQISWLTKVGINYYIRVFGYLESSFGRFSLRVFPGDFGDGTALGVSKTNASDISASDLAEEEHEHPEGP